MAKPSKTGGELFIVDNSDNDWKVARYLRDWCTYSKAIDIATGYFEIGALLTLGDDWQKVDHIRILLGDEVSKRTKRAFVEGLANIKTRLDNSLENEKEKNDFLTGVPAIVEAIKSGKIECRVYRKDKFHAKAYITHARDEILGSFALVGSSNLTRPGLTNNVELNVRHSGTEVEILQAWYERHWNDAEDVTPDLLRVIERHVCEYTPFEVYTKALQEFFRGHEMTGDEWEKVPTDQGGSRMIHVLDQYQIEGYRELLKIAKQNRGAFLCDGVGLGKTFVGLMLIERLTVHERKNVVLFAPKSALESVWKPAIRRYLPHVQSSVYGSRLATYAHTDFQRATDDYIMQFKEVRDEAQVVIIDEAHHFRNPGGSGILFPDQYDQDNPKCGGRIRGKHEGNQSRYRKLYELINGPNGIKTLYMLTATPINNSIDDFKHMIELFSRRNDKAFEHIGIHSITGHFRKIEKQLEKLLGESKPDTQMTFETNMAETEQLFVDDSLFREIVVQRSRAYVKKSQILAGAGQAIFPKREAPKVGEYKLRSTYGTILDMVEKAFDKQTPLFSLAIYYPLAYYTGNEDIDPFAENRQKQVVGLIRTQFLKRIESSTWAFEQSCDRLLQKLLAWVQKHSTTDAEKNQYQRWRNQHKDIIDYVHEHQYEFGEDDDALEEDIVTKDMLDSIDELSRDEYKVQDILAETYLDLNEIVQFVKELRKLDPKKDDKLKALEKLLKTDPVLKKHKVLIFTEFADTAVYLASELTKRGITGIDCIHGSSKTKRLDIIRRFAPYYNDSSSLEIQDLWKQGETRILISTDVLSEGLNLQDCTRLINYDIHWNPVRLMQRIGRVDRRMNPEIEERIIADHPEQKKIRGTIQFWNFLPPDELNKLLTLYTKVTHKTLRISQTLGIEGRQLLTPEDNYNALRDFNEGYEGKTTPVEQMRLDYLDLLKQYPDLEDRLNHLPGRVFSGKEHPKPGSRAVFFCYVIPRQDLSVELDEGQEPPWTEEVGETKWLLYQIDTKKILDEPAEIVEFIRCEPKTPRRCTIEQPTLAEIREEMDRHIKNTDLKRLQAPFTVKPALKCWMELN